MGLLGAKPLVYCSVLNCVVLGTLISDSKGVFQGTEAKLAVSSVLDSCTL